MMLRLNCCKPASFANLCREVIIRCFVKPFRFLMRRIKNCALDSSEHRLNLEDLTLCNSHLLILRNIYNSNHAVSLCKSAVC
jgi:hypothetical protein